ncbi:MAG: AMP-binding protein [Myxococcota bacterium]
MLPEIPSDFDDNIQYMKYHNKTMSNRKEFWKKQAENLVWDQDFTQVVTENFIKGELKWFENGKLNAFLNIFNNIKKQSGFDQDCFILMNNNEIEEKYNYREIMTTAVATMELFQNIGVKKDDRVLLFLPNGKNAITSLLALSAIGAAAIPFSTSYPPAFLLEVMEDCQSKALLIDSSYQNSKYQEKIQKLNESVEKDLIYDFNSHSVKTTKTDPEDLIKEHDFGSVSAPAPLFISYHPTGARKPRGYTFATGGFLVQAKYTYAKLLHNHNSTSTQKHLYFDGKYSSPTALAYGIWGCFCNGDCLVLNSASINPEQAQLKEISKVGSHTTLMIRPPRLSELTVKSDSDQKFFDRIILHGDICSPRLVKKLQNLTKNPENVISLWIQKQSGCSIIHTLPSAPLNRPGSMGVPAFTVEPFILNDFGQSCPTNQSGELVFSASWPAMATSIYNQKKRFYELHFNKFQGYFNSNDGVRKDSDGFYWFMKRLDDVFKLDGYSLSTSELETVLSGDPEIGETAVIGIEGSESGDDISLFVAPYDKTVLSDPQRGENVKKIIRARIKEKFGDFALPSQIQLLSELPRTKTGKLVRRLLYRIAKKDIMPREDLSHVANPDSIETILNNDGGNSNE